MQVRNAMLFGASALIVLAMNPALLKEVSLWKDQCSIYLQFQVICQRLKICLHCQKLAGRNSARSSLHHLFHHWKCGRRRESLSSEYISNNSFMWQIIWLWGFDAHELWLVHFIRVDSKLQYYDIFFFFFYLVGEKKAWFSRYFELQFPVILWTFEPCVVLW